MSRKRNKGRARKAKAAVQALAPRTNDAPVTNPTVAAATSNSNCGNITELLNGLSFWGAHACHHGLQPPISFKDPMYGFIIEFEEILKEMPASDVTSYAEAFDRLQARGHSHLWDDEAKRARITSYLVHMGTMYILEGNLQGAACVALPIKLVESWGTFGVKETLAAQSLATLMGTPSVAKANADVLSVLRDISGDDRECTKFFDRRNGCSCLREKRKQLKTATKMGWCYGCDEKKARSQLMICSLCHVAQYCSGKCQRADWARPSRNVPPRPDSATGHERENLV